MRIANVWTFCIVCIFWRNIGLPRKKRPESHPGRRPFTMSITMRQSHHRLCRSQLPRRTAEHLSHLKRKSQLVGRTFLKANVNSSPWLVRFSGGVRSSSWMRRRRVSISQLMRKYRQLSERNLAIRCCLQVRLRRRTVCYVTVMIDSLFVF